MEGLCLNETRLAIERARGIWPDRLISDDLDRLVTTRPRDTAIIAFREETQATTRLTYHELNERVACIARVLDASGVGKGDVVAFQLPNWWEFVAVHLACVRIGAVSNPLMPIFRRRELSFMLHLAEAKVLIAPARFRGFDHAALAFQLAHELSPPPPVLLVGGEGADSFEDALARAVGWPGFESGAAMGPNDVVQLLYTSGTTGEPKGALHTSNTLLSAVQQFALRMWLGARDVIFMPSPLAHQLGFCYGMLMSLALGVPLVLTDIWHADRAVDLIARHGATFTFGATPFLADLAGVPGVQRRKLPLRLFASSGAPIPPTIVQAARDKLDVAVAPSWGMTECASVTITPPSGYKMCESDGCSMPSGEVRVFTDDGEEAPRGTQGTLKVRGSSLFVGYLKRPQLYELDADGWFDTGDLARMDEEGYIRICGRKKDIIIRGGENVPVVAIEGALYRMPAVADAAIVAMPDPRLVERACAFVTLRPGAALTLAAVCHHLEAEGISKHFWPERLEIIPEMPRTPTGKIKKFVLRDMASAVAAAPAEGEQSS